MFRRWRHLVPQMKTFSLCLMADKIATPVFAHLSEKEFFSVYQPSEDTFLLVDALEKDLPSIFALRPTVVLEVGSGSGVVSAALSSVLRNSAYFITTDVNECACVATRRTASCNGCVHLEPVVTDLVACVAPRLHKAVDVLIFNPPYVLTPNEEVGRRDISSAWAGGDRGRVVMDRLFPLVDSLLTSNGVFYLVIVKENDQEDIEDVMSKLHFDCDTIMARRTGMEQLIVLKFTRRT